MCGFLNTVNSLLIFASALKETFGTNLIIPNIVMIANTIMNPKTTLQFAKPPKNDPNGTPNITAIVKPAWTSAMACVFLAGGATVAATLIHTPKNGACIAADMSLDNNNTLKFGANIPTKLLIIKIATKIGNRRWAWTFNVMIRIKGPINATLIA